MLLRKLKWILYAVQTNIFLTLALGTLAIACLFRNQKSFNQTELESSSTVAEDNNWVYVSGLENEPSDQRGGENSWFQIRPSATNGDDEENSWFQIHSSEPKPSAKNQVNDLQSQVDALTARVNYDEVRNVHCEIGARLPPHLECERFSANLDFLYWKADEDDLEYATKMVATPVTDHSDVSTKLLPLHFSWDPGFRLGFGYTFNHFDSWALNLSWTHIQNHAHGSASALGTEAQVGDVNTIIPIWNTLFQELTHGATKASAHWKVNFNTIDLSLGRSFFLSKRFVLNPFIGFRGALIDQHYKAKYNTLILPAEEAPTFTQELVFKAKNDFGGFGLRGGGEFLWHFNQHWNLFTQLSGSALYGKFQVKMKNLNGQGLIEGEIPSSPLNFYASEKFWRVRLNFEESIGLGWETYFHCDRYHLSCRVAYELSQWLNQNELYYTFYFTGQDTISSIPIRNEGNLSFHGIRAGVQFDF